jgi:hypothetical protein
MLSISVAFSLLITLSQGPRANRVGVTLYAMWAVCAMVIFMLKGMGDPLPTWAYGRWIWPTGIALGTWAIWDVARLARTLGTSSLMSAADLARGFLTSPGVDAAAWALWAQHLPTAAFVKGRDGVMLAINPHYEHRYGKPARGYTGATDGDEWTDDVAKVFAENDSRVLRLGTPVVVREPCPTWDNPSAHGLILKFPVRDQRGQIVGVGGIELTHQIKHAEHDEHEGGILA